MMLISELLVFNKCIKCVYDTGQELIAGCDDFKIIQNLSKNEIIEFIFYISTVDVI